VLVLSQKVKKLSKMLSARKMQYSCESKIILSLVGYIINCDPSLPSLPPSSLPPTTSFLHSLSLFSFLHSLSLFSPFCLCSLLSLPSVPPSPHSSDTGVVELTILQGRNLVAKDSNGELSNSQFST